MMVCNTCEQGQRGFTNDLIGNDLALPTLKHWQTPTFKKRIHPRGVFGALSHLASTLAQASRHALHTKPDISQRVPKFGHSDDAPGYSPHARLKHVEALAHTPGKEGCLAWAPPPVLQPLAFPSREHCPPTLPARLDYSPPHPGMPGLPHQHACLSRAHVPKPPVRARA